MAQKDRLKKQIESARGISEGMLESFQSPEQWVHQVDPTANHALWFAGHMGVTDNFFIAMIDANRVQDQSGYQDLFGMGSTPTDDPAAYPAVEAVLAYMRERRATLLSLLDGLSDADLGKPVPEGSPDMWTDLASVYETVVWHEGIHAGQISIARRSLGNRPIMGAEPEAASP